MRVALVVTGGFDPSGRQHVIPTLLALVERLSRRHQVVVYVLRYLQRPTTYPLLGATICDLGRPRGLWRQYGALLDRLKRDGPFDLLHAYWGLPAGFVTAAAARRLQIPSVLTCDSGEFAAIPDIDYGSQLHVRQRWAIRFAASRAAALTVCSSYQAALASAHGWTAQIIPLGVDTASFTPADRDDEPPWRLLHVASLNPVKDHETLLRAFQILVQHHVDAHLDIVGEDTLRGAAADLAVRLGVADRVHFLGFQPTDSLIPIYQRSHLFVLSSRHEAAGAVVLEAAACGVPAVGTAVGYLAEWSPQRARAVPPRDPAALAAAIEALLQRRDDRLRLAASARDWVVAHDADWTSREFERLYAKLVTPGS